MNRDIALAGLVVATLMVALPAAAQQQVTVAVRCRQGEGAEHRFAAFDEGAQRGLMDAFARGDDSVPQVEIAGAVQRFTRRGVGPDEIERTRTDEPRLRIELEPSQGEVCRLRWCGRARANARRHEPRAPAWVRSMGNAWSPARNIRSLKFQNPAMSNYDTDQK